MKDKRTQIAMMDEMIPRSFPPSFCSLILEFDYLDGTEWWPMREKGTGFFDIVIEM